MEINYKEALLFVCKEFTLAALLIFVVSIVTYPAYQSGQAQHKSQIHGDAQSQNL